MSNLMSSVYIAYVAEVIYKDGAPTLELRVRVPSIHSAKVPVAQLPIAKPMIIPGSEFNSETLKDMASKLNKVYVIFESGDYNKPVYFGIKGNGDLYDLPTQSVFIRTYPSYVNLPATGNMAYLYRVIDTGILYMWDPVHLVYTPFVVPSIATSSIWFDPNSGLSQGDITDVGRLFYDIERHTLTFLTDLGEYLEIGSNLGDFGKNDNGVTYEAAPVALTGVQGESPIKLFEPADASVPELSTMVGVLTTTDNGGSLSPGAIGKVSVFGDVAVPSWANILDSTFLADLGLTQYKDIPAGTKLYLSTEAGKYSALPVEYPNTNIWMATVVYMSPSGVNGRIFVYPHRDTTAGSGDTFNTPARVYTNTGPTTGLRTIDGIDLEADDLVLVVGAVGIQNGIYKVSVGAWTKMYSIFDKYLVAINEGLVYGGTILKTVSNSVQVVKNSELTKWSVI